jgi:hypothetical protein
MKIMMRNWPWLTCLLAVGLVCATYLLAQTQGTQTTVNAQTLTTNSVAAPVQAEAADCARLIDAVNAGDAQTALEILHNYGMAENTLLAMAPYLVKTPANVQLKEPFLKASVAALAITDRLVKTNIHSNLQNAIANLGYEQPVWMPRRPDIQAIASYDQDLVECPVPPIGVLNVRSNEPCFIRYFKWYDRYADYLHSVAVNGPNLSNASMDVNNYAQANRILNALFRLIKARKPEAFVWLSVVKKDDHSDEQWLRAMTFRPDGLQISNLRQFHSPFAETRARYVQIVGSDMPMMVNGFYGYETALQAGGKKLAASLANADLHAARTEKAAAIAELGGIGVLAGPNLAEVETNLQLLGYRGLSTHWLLLAAIANSSNAVASGQADILDPRAGLLDTYFEQADYTRMITLAASMISNSAPGDMRWTAGKLYQGIALLSQSPPQTKQAITVLDQVLAFDFNNRPGRDHYILGAAKWRIRAAFLSGDTQKGPALVQWVQAQNFRTDLKTDFLKTYGDMLASPAISQ